MSVTQPQTETRTAWSFDPAHSSIEFSVKHMMVTTVRGRFTGVTGRILEDPNDLANADVEVDIEAASIDTRNEQRDAHLRSADFLDAETYPTITFRSTRIEPRSEDEVRVTGDLTLHGVTRPVTLDATINGRGSTPFGTEVAGISLTGSINRKDFGLNWNVALETGGVLVGDKIKIDIEIEAIKQS